MDIEELTVAWTSKQKYWTGAGSQLKPDYDSQQSRKPLPKFDPVKGPHCFECNGYGHYASDCPKSREKDG